MLFSIVMFLCLGAFVAVAITTPPVDGPAALLDVRAVAAMLDCSPRHVYRLADSGRLPQPIKLGALIRWRHAELELWLADGCPPCSKGGK